MNRPPVWPPTQEPSPHLRQHLRLIFRTVSVTFLGVAVGTALNIQTPLLRTAYETVYGHMLHVPILSGILHLPTPLFQMVFIGLFVLQLYLAYRWRRSRIDTGDPPAAAAAAAAAASAASGPGPDPASSFRAHLSSFFTEAWSTQPPPTSAPSGPADCGATSQRPTASTTAQPWSLSSLVTTPAGWMNLRLGTIGLMSAMLGPRILSMITPLTHQPSMLFGTFVFLLQSALFGMVAATEGNLLALPPWVSRLIEQGSSVAMFALLGSFFARHLFSSHYMSFMLPLALLTLSVSYFFTELQFIARRHEWAVTMRQPTPDPVLEASRLLLHIKEIIRILMLLLSSQSTRDGGRRRAGAQGGHHRSQRRED